MNDLHLYLGMLGNLGIVVAVIVFYFGAMYWFNRAKRSKSQSIALLSTLSIGAKEKIAIIEVGKQKYLLGITAQHISLISKLNDENDVASFDELYHREEVTT